MSRSDPDRDAHAARIQPKRPWRNAIGGIFASVAGALIVTAVGWSLTEASFVEGTDGDRKPPRFGWVFGWFSESLARLSYDLPFLVRGRLPTGDVCIVYLDESSAKALGQSTGAWDRRLHSQLVRRLAEDGARAVFFDIVFASPSSDAAADEDFAAAMREHGNVFLGASLDLQTDYAGRGEQVFPPAPALRRAAKGWGLLAFRPVDQDYGVRRMYLGTERIPAATWRAAHSLGAPLSDTPDARSRWLWLNYYGASGSFPSVPYARAIAEDGARPGFFKNRIVLVGGRQRLGTLSLGKDDFATPFTRRGSEFSTGTEIHATALLNLLTGEWLSRMEGRSELLLVLCCGIFVGGILPRLRPHSAAALSFLTIALVCGTAYSLFATHRIWFAWAIPALIQTPAAFAWSMGSRYFLEERQRNALRRAFRYYLSPHMADRIADADFTLEPGGVEVEATILLTDIEGFTTLSETMSPQELSQLLTSYFTQTTGHILDNDGTIIKFIGDAVLAVWNAPIEDPGHPHKAADAALKLAKESTLTVDGKPLHTRIGLHTGPVLAGNLGSAQRFDYTVIGDAVNLAARLEGLNKYLGTTILVSESTIERIGDEFIARKLGKFRVAGKTRAVTIYELLAPFRDSIDMPWIATFGKGLEAFQSGDLDVAERWMNETHRTRGQKDGPAAFYLERIAEARSEVRAHPWTGEVELATK